MCPWDFCSILSPPILSTISVSKVLVICGQPQATSNFYLMTISKHNSCDADNLDMVKRKASFKLKGDSSWLNKKEENCMLRLLIFSLYHINFINA